MRHFYGRLGWHALEAQPKGVVDKVGWVKPTAKLTSVEGPLTWNYP